MALLVNGEAIDDAALREERRAIRRLLAERMPGEPPAALDKRAHEWAKDNLIERVLLRQAADNAGRPLEQFIEGLTSHTSKPRNKDLVDYYKKNREEFYAPEGVRARHIVRNIDEANSEDIARAAIEQALAELQNGSPFEDVADRLSDCPGNGGDLGFFVRGQMVEEFESVAFALPSGATSGIFKSPFGFHILKVCERRAAGTQPLEAVRGRVEEELLARKKQKVLEQYVDALRAKAEIRDE